MVFRLSTAARYCTRGRVDPGIVAVITASAGFVGALPTTCEWRPSAKNDEAHELVLVDEVLAIVQRAWARRRPDSDFLFHIDGKPLGSMRSEVRRTCTVLGIPYGRGKGIVFHDTPNASPGRTSRGLPA